MQKTITVSGKTVEAALNEASVMTGLPVEKLTYEVLEQAKKGFLGIGGSDAKLTVSYEELPQERAVSFIKTFLDNMGFTDIDIETKTDEEGEIHINLNGENLGLIIGRHGEFLDSLQYLANLAANKREKHFVRITVNIENYREKREEALKALAHKMADKVLKSGKSISLEPMNSYERRIIHSEVQDIDGVITFSVGSGDDRKIIVAPDSPKRPGVAELEATTADIKTIPRDASRPAQRRSDRPARSPRSDKPQTSKPRRERPSAPATEQSSTVAAPTAAASATVASPAAKPAADKQTAPKKPVSSSAPVRTSYPASDRNGEKKSSPVAGSAPKVYEYNPKRPPQQIKKVKSIEELGLADVEDTEDVIIKK